MVAVVGAGKMDDGTEEVFALSGFEVILDDVDEELVHKGKGRIQSDLLRGENFLKKKCGLR